MNHFRVAGGNQPINEGGVAKFLSFEPWASDQKGTIKSSRTPTISDHESWSRLQTLLAAICKRLPFVPGERWSVCQCAKCFTH